MGAGRVEAFSDGVIAVIVTIMVLELKPPATGDWAALWALRFSFLNYLLSFVVVTIMWVNHRPMLALVHHMNGKVLWANNTLLFWMSLIPLVTAYMGQTHGAALAVAAYGATLRFTAGAFTLLRYVIADQHRADEALYRLHRRIHFKNVAGTILYSLSVPLAFLSVYASFFIFILIPALYFLPERKLEEQHFH